MGRHLKNTVLRSGSYSVVVPSGTNAMGPDSPIDGQLRFNQTLEKIEYRANGKWLQIAHEGASMVTKDVFVGDGSTVSFNMTYSYPAGQEAQVLVFANTVFQNPGVDYTFNGSYAIDFATTPIVNATILVLHNFASSIAA